MRPAKLFSLGAGLVLALAFCVAAARADVTNQATQITFEQPVRVPGHVLPAGTYWFTVDDTGPANDLNAVQIRNADGTKVMAQLQTANADQAQEGQDDIVNGVHWPNGKVVLTFVQGRPGQPMALLDWYYPGRTDGHRFVYSNKREKQMREEEHQTVEFNPGDKITIGRSLVTFD
jgi:hypothetical protein